MTGPDIADIAEIVRRLDDKDQIRDLIYRYAHYADINDREAFASLFVADCVLDLGPGLGIRRGQAATRHDPSIQKGLTRGVMAMSHLNPNILITFDGQDRASVITAVYSWHRSETVPNGEVWGEYHDVVVRENGAWKFKERVLKASGDRDYLTHDWNYLERLPYPAEEE
jgi:SnoaL-like domain